MRFICLLVFSLGASAQAVPRFISTDGLKLYFNTMRGEAVLEKDDGYVWRVTRDIQRAAAAMGGALMSARDLSESSGLPVWLKLDADLYDGTYESIRQALVPFPMPESEPPRGEIRVGPPLSEGKLPRLNRLWEIVQSRSCFIVTRTSNNLEVESFYVEVSPLNVLEDDGQMIQALFDEGRTKLSVRVLEKEPSKLQVNLHLKTENFFEHTSTAEVSSGQEIKVGLGVFNRRYEFFCEAL